MTIENARKGQSLVDRIEQLDALKKNVAKNIEFLSLAKPGGDFIVDIKGIMGYPASIPIRGTEVFEEIVRILYDYLAAELGKLNSELEKL